MLEPELKHNPELKAASGCSESLDFLKQSPQLNGPNGFFCAFQPLGYLQLAWLLAYSKWNEPTRKTNTHANCEVAIKWVMFVSREFKDQWLSQVGGFRALSALSVVRMESKEAAECRDKPAV